MLAIISFELNDLDVFSLHVAVAIENHTLFQNKHRRNDISVNSGGLAKLYTLSGGDMPRNLPRQNNGTSANIRFHFPALPYN